MPVVPLSVIVDHDVYVEGEDLPQGELGRALTRVGLASTSRPAPAVFLATYERLAAVVPPGGDLPGMALTAAHAPPAQATRAPACSPPRVSR